MYEDSFWYPDEPKKAILLAAVLVMIPLHQTELLGLMDSTWLVFGWLPAQLAYDMAYTVVAGVIGYVIYVTAPTAPPEFEPTVEEGEP